MNLLDYRSAVKDGLTAGLPSLRAVEAFGGRVDSRELQRMLAAAPAAHVAVLGVNPATQLRGGAVALSVDTAVFLTTASRPGTPRDAAALTLLDALLRLIPESDWGLDSDVQPPTGIRAQNLYGAEIDKKGLALWAVTWRQQIFVGGTDEALLDAFVTFHADYDMGDTVNTPEPSDDVSLPQ